MCNTYFQMDICQVTTLVKSNIPVPFVCLGLAGIPGVEV